MAQFHRQTSWFVLATVIACLGGAPLRAADDPAEQVLKKHGLRLVGLLAVAETEAPFKSKLTEARRIAQQIRLLRMQASSTMSNEERQQAIYSLNQSMGQLRNELNAVTRQLNQVPVMRGRLLNNYAYAAVDELQAYRASLQVELSEESAMLNQLRGPGADPKAKEKIDAGIKEKTATYNQDFLDLFVLAEVGIFLRRLVSQLAQVDQCLIVRRGFLLDTGVNLLRGLESANESTIEYAAKALGKFGMAGAAAVPRLRVLKEKAVSAQARAAAASSLEAIEGVAVSQPEAK